MATPYVHSGDPAKNRHRGSAASNRAFQKNRHLHKCDRELIWHMLRRKPFGMTSKEIAMQLEKPIHAISGRITELKQAERVHGTGERRGGSEVIVAINPQMNVFEGVEVVAHG